MAIFGYGRVSTKDQTTENQRQEIERAGYPIKFWFADTGISGKTPASQRPQFAEMLGKIRDGETLVVSKLDRLGRDATDVRATIDVLGKRGIEVIILQFGKVDMQSPVGKMILSTLAAVAELERDLLIERTQAGLQRAKAEGKKLGRRKKTTPAQRIEIAEGYRKEISVSELARRYSVSRATILDIVRST